MKKLIIILFSVLIIFTLSSCDVSELSAPADDTTVEETTEKSDETTAEETTEKSDETTNSGEQHTDCDYCGQLEGESRWFIAEVSDDLMIHPLGSDCFEARSAMDAGINLWYKSVDGDTNKKLKSGDIVKITYNGMIMESYPVQISADEVIVIGYEEGTKKSHTIAVNDDILNSDIFISSNGVTITPLKSMCFEKIRDSEKDIYYKAEGLGAEEYIYRLKDYSMRDSDIPLIQVNDVLEITLGKYSTIRKAKFIIPSVNLEMSENMPIEDIINLPDGKYYVILQIGTEYSKGSYEINEFLFKLIIGESRLSIREHVFYDVNENANYLELPISKNLIRLNDDELELTKFIDSDLLSYADDNLTYGHNQVDELWIELDDENYLCLCIERIRNDNSEFGHSHEFQKIRISKEPCY